MQVIVSVIENVQMCSNSPYKVEWLWHGSSTAVVAICADGRVVVSIFTNLHVT